MNRRHDPKPFDEEEEVEVNPFSKGAGSKSRPEPYGFGQKHDATVDIPLDTMNQGSKKKERELAAWEADLKRKEKELQRREDSMKPCGRMGEVGENGFSSGGIGTYFPCELPEAVVRTY